MPKDYVISETDDAALVAFLAAEGVIAGGEGGFVAKPGFVLSYIGKAKNPDLEPILDQNGNDTRPDLPGVCCLVGVEDTVPGISAQKRTAILTKLTAREVTTTKPLRIWAGKGDVPYWELPAEAKKV